MSSSNLKTKPKILIGICSPMVFLLILGAVAVFNINTLVKTSGWVDHTRVVHVVRLDDERIRSARYLKRDISDLSDQRRIGGRHVRLQLDTIGANDSEQWRAFVV